MNYPFFPTSQSLLKLSAEKEREITSQSLLKLSAERKRGFTLVELMITIAVLTLGILVAIQVQTSSLMGSNVADNLTAATFLAEAEMERLKSLSFSELTLETENESVTTTGLNRLGLTDCQEPAECSNYIFDRTVNYFAQVPTSLSHQVEISVTWQDSAGKHTVLYSGAISSLSF
jgi:prepilin-type N-terminal cleavage/methylation domain-containing protein